MTSQADTEQARQLFVEGIACFEAGRYADAERKFESSLALVPSRASTLTNLALSRIRLGKAAQALAPLEQVIEIEPDNADAWFQRGVALGDLGRHEDALASHEKALAMQPERPELWFHHAQTLQRLDRPEQALVSYDKVVALDPGHAQAWSQRGGILQDSKRLDEAAASFEKALALGADRDINGYFLAAARGRGAPGTAPRHYVEPMFDDYAERFDEHLRVLNYQAPTVLTAHLKTIAPGGFKRALDLGCGTGLCGPLLRPMVEQLDGVDLSTRMLDQARTLGVYDHLVHAEMLDHLRGTTQRYDLVLAADVFIYVGELDLLFAAVRRVMLGGGVYCFSAEATDDSNEFVLTPGLRYAHSQRYLLGLAVRHGFEVVKIVSHPIREDQRKPVAGLYVYLTPH
jgi:predicted TPR repeat methyltransferase